jgi:hypothetical protein
MKVNDQFHAHASIPWGHATQRPQSGMDHRGGQNFGEKQNNVNPEISARRIDSLLLFIFIVITDFILTGLGIAILKLNIET